MKKNIIYSLSLFLLLSLSACNQWLEVEPKTEIKSDKMFENETGFRDALIGCYMMMADSTLYGRESTVCFFDVLAQQYDMASKEKPSVCGLSCTLNCCAYSAGEIWRTSLPTWTSFPSLT